MPLCVCSEPTGSWPVIGHHEDSQTENLLLGAAPCIAGADAVTQVCCLWQSLLQRLEVLAPDLGPAPSVLLLVGVDMALCVLSGVRWACRATNFRGSYQRLMDGIKESWDTKRLGSVSGSRSLGALCKQKAGPGGPFEF